MEAELALPPLGERRWRALIQQVTEDLDASRAVRAAVGRGPPAAGSDGRVAVCANEGVPLGGS